MDNAIGKREHVHNTYHNSENFEICPHLVEWEQSVILLCRAWNSTYVTEDLELRKRCKNHLYKRCHFYLCEDMIFEERVEYDEVCRS
jgi:hypothetical protein